MPILFGKTSLSLSLSEARNLLYVPRPLLKIKMWSLPPKSEGGKIFTYLVSTRWQFALPTLTQLSVSRAAETGGPWNYSPHLPYYSIEFNCLRKCTFTAENTEYNSKICNIWEDHLTSSIRRKMNRLSYFIFSSFASDTFVSHIF